MEAQKHTPVPGLSGVVALVVAVIILAFLLLR